MASFPVPPDLLQPHVPAGTRLDRWEGRAWCSVVAFRFTETRILGWSVPGHRHFVEINVRFYVRRDGPAGERRGVVFLREIVPRRAIAWLARVVYHEPYLARPTRDRVVDPTASAPGTVEYAWRDGERWAGLQVELRGEPAIPAEGTFEAFIAEHYWGYNRQPDGSTLEYRVDHPRWAVWPAGDVSLSSDVAAGWGSDLVPLFGAVLRGGPARAFVAAGSLVAVYRGERLPDTIPEGP